MQVHVVTTFYKPSVEINLILVFIPGKSHSIVKDHFGASWPWPCHRTLVENGLKMILVPHDLDTDDY